MTAAIIQFPQRASDARRLAEVGKMLTTALPPPQPSSELERLLESADALLQNLNDAALDRWLRCVDEWEAKSAGLPSA